MADNQAGIMALQQQPQPQLPLEDSYDAMTTAAENVAPGAKPELEAILSKLMPILDGLSIEQLDKLIRAIQFLHDHPEEYEARIADLVAKGLVQQGDFPPKYDPEFLATMGMALLEAKKRRGPAPAPAPEGFAAGGIADAAKAVAASGRGNDTMLAHINPKEAAMLKKAGGMGVINPQTGLPEYDFFSDAWRGVSDAVSSLGNGVKDVLKSPVGQIIGTVALASFGIPLPLASAGVTLLGGGNLKDAAINAGMAYLGGTGGPLSGLTSGISNPLLAAGARGMVTGVTGGLLRGQSLQDAVRSGLVQGTIQAGSSYMAPSLAQQNLAPVEDVSGKAITTANMPLAPVPVDSTGAPYTEELGNRVAGYPALTPEQINAADYGDWATGGNQPMGAPVDSQGRYYTDDLGNRVAVQPSGGIMDTIKQGAQEAWTGAKDIYKEYFDPSRNMPTADQINTRAAELVKNTPNLPFNTAVQQATKELTPGWVSQYGPLAAAGLGITALAGGFKPTPAPASTLNQTTGADLLAQNPSKYLPVLGGRSPATMQDIRVPSAGYGQQYQFMPYQPVRFAAAGSPMTGEQGIASLMKGGYPRRTGQISGPGTETSDDIPAMLSDGEFVMTAKAVRGAGNGSRRAGAKRMYALMHQLERNAERG